MREKLKSPKSSEGNIPPLWNAYDADGRLQDATLRMCSDSATVFRFEQDGERWHRRSSGHDLAKCCNSLVTLEYG